MKREGGNGGIRGRQDELRERESEEIYKKEKKRKERKKTLHPQSAFLNLCGGKKQTNMNINKSKPCHVMVRYITE